jgi:hypothetical protein
LKCPSASKHDKENVSVASKSVSMDVQGRGG